MTTWTRFRRSENRQRVAKPFCVCYEEGSPPISPDSPGSCKCGELGTVHEWSWEAPTDEEASWVLMTLDQKQVTFHPFYSSGTAMVRGDTPFEHDYHYYWEVKMLTEPYGTDIMVGIGTDKVDKVTTRYRFTSLLGQDAESYGLSYTGAVRHNDQVARDGVGFCKGSVVGVKVDLWQGTVEFFINRQSRGISFFNLRRHPNRTLYPMVCSTAAQSTMRLIYTGSWRASLLVDAARSLGQFVQEGTLMLPPGLKNNLGPQFWLTLPNDCCILERKKRKVAPQPSQCQEKYEANYIFQPDIPFRFNDYYTDNVDENFRIAIVVNDLDHNMDADFM